MLADVLLRTQGKTQLLVAATDLNVSLTAELEDLWIGLWSQGSTAEGMDGTGECGVQLETRAAAGARSRDKVGCEADRCGCRSTATPDAGRLPIGDVPLRLDHRRGRRAGGCFAGRASSRYGEIHISGFT